MRFQTIKTMLLTTMLIHMVHALDDSICGLANHGNPFFRLSRHRRMVNGDPTLPNEFPWQVRLTYPLGDGRSTLCGGTIIDRNWILTAAHCTEHMDDVSQLIVIVGDHDQFNDYDGAFIIRAKNIIVHPQHDYCTRSFDFALIQLIQPLTWTQSVRPACLPQDTSADYADAFATTSGWGRLAEEQDRYPDVLQKAVLKVTSAEQCEQHLREVDFMSAEADLCAYEEGKAPCKGDSGGPLVTLEGGNGYRYTLIGVVSRGVGCARTGYPSVYGRVTKAIPWIEDIVRYGSCRCRRGKMSSFDGLAMSVAKG